MGKNPVNKDMGKMRDGLYLVNTFLIDQKSQAVEARINFYMDVGCLPVFCRRLT